MRRLVLCALLVCGCGHVGFDAVPDAADAAAADVAPDALRLRDCAWTTNPTVGPLVHHTELSGINAETDPLLVRGDPLTIYFSRDLTPVQFDVFTAHRPALDQSFDAPQPVTELASASNEFGLQTDTTHHGYFVRGPQGATNIYELQANTFGAYEIVRSVTELDSGGEEFDPFVSADGLTIYFTAGPQSNQDIYFASRNSTAEPFANITPFQHNSAGPDGGATLTSDGLLIVWASSPNTATQSDIYFATRPTLQSPWSDAQLLGPGTISGAVTHDLEPDIREDGCELIFARSTAQSDGNWDIYSATLQ